MSPPPLFLGDIGDRVRGSERGSRGARRERGGRGGSEDEEDWMSPCDLLMCKSREAAADDGEDSENIIIF